MKSDILIQILRFLVLFILQIVVLNHFSVAGYATPFLILYAMMKLPLKIPASIVITIGFALGLCLDLFNNTPGVNTLSMTVVSFFRGGYARLLLPKDDFLPKEISIAKSGFNLFLTYSVGMTFLFSFLFYVTESMFSLYWTILLLKIFSSFISTLILIMIVEMGFFKDKRE